MRRLYLVLLPSFLSACAHQQIDNYDSAGRRGMGAATAPSSASTAGESASATAGESAACRAARVHFDRDDTMLHPDDYPILQKLAECLQQDHAKRLRIDGNADERGTTEYNLALGERRARQVASYLKLLGVPSDQLATVSYGKEKPLCAEHDEACWRENRRAGLTLAQ